MGTMAKQLIIIALICIAGAMSETTVCTSEEAATCGTATCEIDNTNGKNKMCLCSGTEWFDESSQECKPDSDCDKTNNYGDMCAEYWTRCSNSVYAAGCAKACECPRYKTGMTSDGDIELEDEIMFDIMTDPRLH